MLTLISALIVAGAVVWAADRIAGAAAASRDGLSSDRALQILEIFAPAVALAARDARALVVWQPLAVAARRMFPDEFASLDRAAGTTFPFSREQLQAAHSRWTAEWLAWERTHDTEYKLKAAVITQELASSGASAAVRAKLDAVEGEKLELYQRRYEEYIRVAKALQALGGT